MGMADGWVWCLWRAVRRRPADPAAGVEAGQACFLARGPAAGWLQVCGPWLDHPPETADAPLDSWCRRGPPESNSWRGWGWDGQA